MHQNPQEGASSSHHGTPITRGGTQGWKELEEAQREEQSHEQTHGSAQLLRTHSLNLFFCCPREVGSGASTEPTCREAIPQHRAAISSPGDGCTRALLTFPHPTGKLRGQGGNETLRQCPSSDLQRGFFSKISNFSFLSSYFHRASGHTHPACSSLRSTVQPLT